MSFNTPRPRALCNYTLNATLLALLCCMVVFIIFATCMAVKHEARSGYSPLSRSSDQTSRASQGRDNRGTLQALRMGQAHREAAEG